MIVVIPAYRPEGALLDVVSGLTRADPGAEIVVVDDGSGPGYAEVFAAVRSEGATVLTHPRNRGKGAALRTAFGYVASSHVDHPVVTADADGQHTVADIVRVGDAVRADVRRGDHRTMVLGCRGFVGRVPLRSRVGNAASRGLFRAGAGWAPSDTQTGLRGFPAAMLPWLAAQPGDRFEYEQKVLLRVRGAGWDVREIEIETVYRPHNPTSHFRPIVDSARVLGPLLAFAGSSFLSFLIDTVALLVFASVTGLLIPSVIAARVLSATVNFAINRRLVFRAGGGRRRLWRQATKYAVLAAALLASNIVWMSFLTDAGVPLLLAKVITEGVLFVTAYQAQRAFVFARRDRSPAGVGEAGGVSSGAEAAQGNHIETVARMDVETQLAGRKS